MKTHIKNLFLALAISLFPTGRVCATDTSRYVVNKHQQFNQTTSGAAVFRTPSSPYEFEVAANADTTNLVLGLSVKLPNGTSQSGTLQGDQPGYALNAAFSTLAALDAAYPAGQYAGTITNANDGIKKVTNNLPVSIYPSTPHVSNYDTAQKINPLADFTVTWDAFTNGTANDFIVLQVSDTNGHSVFSSPTPGTAGTLTGLSNAVVIPANSFTAGQTYSAKLWFYKVINLDTTSYPGATSITVFWKRTFFNLQTVNPFGIFPIATDPNIVQFGGGLTYDGTNYIAGFVAGTNICAQILSSNGTLIGPQIIVGSNPGFPPAIAGALGQSNYLAAWSDKSISSGVDMFGQFISRTGAKIGSPFNLLAAQGAHGFQKVQALASDGTNFLVVWQDKTNKFIYGQTVTPVGALSGPEFLISGQQQNSTDASVLFGKTNYLVAWQSSNASGAETNKTYGNFVSKAGVASGPFQISQTTSPSHNPVAVAFDGTNYVVAWNRDISAGFPAPISWDIYGRLVSQTGTFPGNEFTMVTNSGNEVLPALAFDGANYLMAWGQESFSSTNSNIRFQFFNRSLAAVGPQFTLFPVQGTNTPLITFNGVIFDGTHFAIAATVGTVALDPNQGVTNIPSGLVYGAFIPSSTASPRVDATGSLVGTQFSLQLTGTPGINYALQFSTNLASPNWTAFATNSPTNGIFNFTDTSATNKNRFYRALKQ